ncbi:4Fe-4S binding protein [Massilicoli timonensis]|uniref:4Fe-4S binding protein n=1 Tax=Massilicoli timonensis TaxID=2015901 RepID=UPI003AAFCFF4
MYFLTAKGKGFYHRLKKNEYVALTGIHAGDTLSRAAVSVRGKVQEIGKTPLLRLFEKNPYMNEIYPSEESRQALTVFHLYEGSGEWFDLSKKPIERASFTIGSKQEEKQGYEITQKCNGCRTCQTVCPQDCIDFSIVPAVIRQGNCLHCGNCFHVCPQKAVIRRG